MPKKNQNKEIQTRFRSVDISEVKGSEDSREIEVIWTTGATVRRHDWDGDYDEELVVSDSTVNLERLNSGNAPVLDTHSKSSTDNIVGVVLRAWIENGIGKAIVRISKREDVEGIWQDIQDRILRNLSIGYRVNKFEVTEEDGKVPLYRAVDWEPYEISLVPVGADAGAVVRSQDDKNTCDFVYLGNRNKDNDDMPVPNKENAAETGSQVDAEAIRAEATKKERERIRSINDIATKANLGSDFVARMSAADHSVDKVREFAFDEMAKKSEEVRTSPSIQIGIDYDSKESKRAAIETALAARHSKHVIPEGKAREYMGMSLAEMMRDYTGSKERSSSALVERAMTTSDFPAILANVGHKILIPVYNEAQQSFKSIARIVTVNDFKPSSLVSLGSFPDLKKLKQNGEFEQGKVNESGENIKVETYASSYSITRQSLVNDDVMAFANHFNNIGLVIAKFENKRFWEYVKENGKLADGSALFNASRGNYNATATALSYDAISAARVAMRNQKGLDKEKLGIGPKSLVVSPENETKAEQYCSSVYVPNEADKINVFAGKLAPICEAELSGKDWYLFADPMMNGLTVAYLEGEIGPRVRTSNPDNAEATKISVALDFGVGAAGAYGTYFQKGA